MPRKYYWWLVGGIAAALILVCLDSLTRQDTRVMVGEFPNDWFYRQRAFPGGDIPHGKYLAAIRQAQEMLKSRAIKTAQWEFAGPSNIGGRISDIEVSPGGIDTIYAGAATGGVFKSVDGGQNWQPVFDHALSLSVGDIAIDPGDSRVIYVGTGEVNAGGGSQTYDGAGIYKSADAGLSWEHLGMEETRYIGRIVIDPQNSQRIFAATMGRLFANSPERGLYRSINGGQTWEQVLYLSDSTGCIDVAINPDSPDTIYAAMWERIRRPQRRSYGGVTSGLYRSIDGGDSWSELINGLPHGAPDVGRIGISICASQPNILYAIYADVPGFFDGVYKTTNGGDTWVRTNDAALNGLYSSYGWWFGNIRVSPTDPNTVFALGLDVYKTTNGGLSWYYSSGNMHVDQHALFIHPQNPDFIVVGNDGGVYLSQNGGASYIKSSNLSITQFYTCEIDNQQPQRLYGGTQDNGTIRTTTGSLSDWHGILGGDGFYVKVDPANNNFVYAESQWGGLQRSTGGGAPGTFFSALSGVSFNDRFNWSAPLAIDPGNPEVLYFGTHRLYRSVNRAASWTPISPDLTNGSSTGNLVFGTITTIDVAPSHAGTVYAGTDDGNVWVTHDSGSSWTQISADLPQRWITRVTVDPDDENTAYVTISGYRWDSYQPHIFRTTDSGISWQDISGNLPDAPLNDVIVDPQQDSTLYVASDAGVFLSYNLGGEWLAAASGLPNVPVTDLTLHAPTRSLVAATYGRSMFRLDLSTLTGLPGGMPDQTPQDFHLAQNYPNPFNGSTEISFRLPKSELIVVDIFDITGRKVRRLTEKVFPPGWHSLQWNGRDQAGQQLSSGIYIYRARAGHRVLAKRMILEK